MKRPWIIPVGGFLGAGKTTLILAAARVLIPRGLLCAAILNDQAGDLIDTEQALRHGLNANEVAGGCFCCRFSEMIERIEELRAAEPDVIFAEPVGSCTDLSATVLRPLIRDFGDRCRIAPLTVLVDPARARELLLPNRDANFGFLFDHQIAEADIVVFTKSEMNGYAPELPGVSPRFVSAVTGEGVAAWLDDVLSGTRLSGARPLDIEYESYARAEAALGWLNWRGTIRLPDPLTPAEIAGSFVDALDAALTAAGARIAHLKLLDAAEGGYVKVAQTANGAEPRVEGDLTASPATRHDLFVNLRAAMDARALDRLFRAELAKLPGDCHEESYECFSPARPEPERRIAVSGFRSQI
ncbi:MAG: CobW-like GTP-binding protein [Acidobacteriota bacterium]|nr:CobW-like GTP-binding protein [Acidobacteriota bacterium]